MNFFEIKESEIPKALFSFIENEGADDLSIENSIREMIENIRKNDFEAVKDYTNKYDNFILDKNNFQLTTQEINSLAAQIEPKLSRSLEIAIERVKAFHSHQIEKSFQFTDSDNNTMGQKIIPLESVAVYVPGGEALYPSTIYMTVIPAILAGVKRIILLSPPRTFKESPEVAKLIQLLGIKEVYRGAGAALIIAAAYGLNNLPAVDKIVGPGNAYVAKAKQLVYGRVDIDMIAGPSEILVLADTNKEKDIPIIAADLLSQAEHGPAGFTRSILVGFNKEFLLKIKERVYQQAKNLPNKEGVLKSLDNRGLILKCDNKTSALNIINKIAPEHLELYSDEPYPLLDKITNAGSIFLGKYTPESVGDYLGGPNHVLPTSGTARFFSPLGVYDYVKRVSWIEFGKSSLKKYKENITSIARSESLEAHARSVEIRFETSK